MKVKWVAAGLVFALLVLSSGAVQAQSPLAPWQFVDDMESGRTGFAAAVAGGYVYAVGGNGPGQNYGGGLVQKYDPVTDTWDSNVAPLPTARHSLDAAVVDGKVYAIGGHVTNSRNENEMYDPDADTWASKAPKPTHVSGPGIAAYGGRIYAFGGNRFGTYQSVIEVYDPGADSWATEPNNMPAAGEPWAAATLGDKIYIAGGAFPSEGGDSNVLWAYDPATKSWDTNLPRLNTPRMFHELVVMGERLFAIGGRNEGVYLDSVECWRPGDPNWTVCPSLNAARSHFGAAAVGDMIYAFGGGGLAGAWLSSTEAAPEPATLSLLAVGALTLIRRGRNRRALTWTIRRAWCAASNGKGAGQ